MGITQIYGLGYLEPFEDVGGDGNIDMDEKRFRTIENETYGIYSLFGNGIREQTDQFGNIIPSWEIQNVAGDSTKVLITSGAGHVGFKYSETTISQNVDIIPPPGSTGNLVFYLYAKTNATTPDLKTVDFIASTITISDPNYVGLGGVIYTITNNGVTLTPENSSDYGRVVISLFGSLSNIINAHKHKGGANNPSPIDLRQHVQGKLSGEFIENLDLSTVIQGTLASERLPQIDHNTLLHKGTLTHSQIDSQLAAINFFSENRMSDIEVTNLMQLALSLKRQMGNFTHIDKNLFNTVFYIPGISPDRFASWYNPLDITSLFPFINGGLYDPYIPTNIPLVTIDTVNHRLLGVSTNTVGNDSITWTSDTDFIIAESLVPVINTEIVGVGTTAFLTINRAIRYVGLANTEFKNTWSQGWLFLDNSNLLRSTDLTAQDNSVSPFRDVFFDQFAVNRYFFKEFITPIDFTGRDKLAVGFGVVGNSDPGSIFLFLIVDGGTLKTFTLQNGQPKTLTISNTTQIFNDGDANSSTLLVIKDLNSFNLTDAQKAAVKGIGIYYSVDTGWDKNSVDLRLHNPTSGEIITSGFSRVLTGIDPITDPGRSSDSSAVFIWNQNLFNDNAQFTFRFDSGYNSTQYTNVSYIPTIQLNDTELLISTRTGINSSDLEANNFFILTENVPITKTGRFIDIQVTFRSDLTRTFTPFLDSLTLSYFGPGSAQSPKIWDTAFVWDNGQFSNVSITGDLLTNRKIPVAFTTKGTYVKLPNPILSGGQFVIPEGTVQDGERLLLTDQGGVGIGTTNGIYQYIGTGNSLIRTTDLQDGSTFNNTFFVQVLRGNTYGGKSFRNTTNGTVGINTLTFVSYSNDLIMSDTSQIGRFLYIRGNNTYYANRPKINPAIEQDEYILEDGSQLYITPRQVFEKISKGFYNPKDMHILPSNNIVIVDTDNDRIVEVDTSGNLVKSIQGNLRLREADRDCVALTATFNARLGKIWITFSQNVSVRDKSLIALVSGADNIPFNSTIPSNPSQGIDVIPFNPIPSDSASSSTLEVNIPDYFLSIIQFWARPLKLVINENALRCRSKSTGQFRSYSIITGGTTGTTGTTTGSFTSGSTTGISGGIIGGGSGGIFGGLSVGEPVFQMMGTDVNLPSFLTGPPALYIKSQLTGAYTGGLTDLGLGLPPLASSSTDNGDFNGDGLILNTDSDTTPIYGPDTLSGKITLTVIEGEIVFDNLYNPLSVHITLDNNWVVAAVGSHSVISYSAFLIRNWNIPFTWANFRTDVLGHVYEMPSSKYIIVAGPAPETLSTTENNKGFVRVLDRTVLLTNPLIADLSIDGDAIRVFPNDSETEFWVAVDDRLGDSRNSGIIRIDYAGSIQWKFGSNVIFVPTGFKILSNGDLLISE